MSITVEETFGRRTSARTSERVYIIKGAEGDAAAARAAMLSAAPTTDGNLFRDSAASEVDEVPGYDGFLGRVQYRGPDDTGGSGVRLDVGQTEFRMSTIGGTTNRKVSLETISEHSIYLAARDFKQLVAVDNDGIPQGVDIPIGGFDFEVTKVYTMAQMDATRINAIRTASGKVNSDTVSLVLTYPNATLTFNAGELLFRGATGAPRGSEEYQVTFQFSGQANKTGITIGLMTGISQDGWDALWVYHEPYDDSGSVAAQPTDAYVERVIERVSLAGLL